MANTIEIKIPDIGDFDQVDVVEVLVEPGDEVAVDDSLITLESDKASMEVPSTAAGVVETVLVAVGDKVGEGATIVRLLTTDADALAKDGGAQSPSPVAGEAPSGPAPVPVQGTVEHTGDYDCDVLVLGSGPGGYAAAFRAADLGQSTILVERDEVLGGVCLNVGCIPSKALLHAARVIDDAEAFGEHGVLFARPEIDLDRLRGWKDQVVGKLVGGLAQLAKRRAVEVITGEGRFTGPHELTVAMADGERRVSFAHAIIAVGSRPVQLAFAPTDDPRLLDSTGALELADVPQRLLVIGGGIIGLEMATVYAALGSRVTVVELLSGLLPGVDRDLVRPLERRIRKSYENVFVDTKVTAITPQENGLSVSFEGEGAPGSDLFDRVLVAVGRRPNGAMINAERAGVAVDERGFIRVDDQQRTNVAHIFAIGDVVGEPMLAHKATHEGKVAAEVAAGEKSGFEATVIPSVAYTDPEVAWVGLTETQAEDQGIAVGKGVFPWAASGRALALGRDEGMTKLLFDPESGRLLGAGVVGPSAGDLIAEAALAIEMRADARDLGLTIHPHPTLSETVAMAAEAFEGTITDLYMPRRR